MAENITFRFLILGLAMLLHDKMIEQLRNGTWETDCFEMILAQNSGDNPSKYTGAGYLRQDDNGSVHFRLYPTSWENVDPASAPRPAGEAGVLVDPQTYSRLVARSFDGKDWEVVATIPDTGGTWNQERDTYQPIISGRAFELCSAPESEIPGKGYSLTMVFFCDVRLPCNNRTTTIKETMRDAKRTSGRLDSVHYETAFGTLRATNEPGQLTVSIRSENRFPEHFESRIIEALGLVLAKPLLWNVLVEFADGVETVRVRARKRIIASNFERPVGSIKDHDSTGDVWRLFSLYLNLVSTQTTPGFHPVSRHLFAVLEASVGGVTAVALTLGVAVESIVKNLFPTVGTPMAGMAGVVPQLQAYVAAWPELPVGELGESLTRRLPGMIGNLTNIRPKDKLHALAMDKVIDDSHPKAWSDIRNTAAHGVTPGSKSNQTLIDLCNQVTVLMYFLIFRGVGYEGPFEDYSTHGYPTKYYRGRPATYDDIAFVAHSLFAANTQRLGHEEHGHDREHWEIAEKRIADRMV